MIDLQRKPVFMSASFPSGAEGEKYGPCEPREISSAVVAFARWIFDANGIFTTAAHPTITPLLIHMSRRREMKNSLTVFRSDWYDSKWIPQLDDMEKDKLGVVTRTRKLEDQKKSLNFMRREMIQDARYAGAIFIGGMQDVEVEYKMFSNYSPDTLRVRIAGAGGAAACLPEGNCEAFGLTDFEQSRIYPFLAHRFVETLAELQVSADRPVRRYQSA